MSNFTTRVELYGSPTADDYNKLHSAMLNSGFERTITLNNVKYWMPHAEYNLMNNYETTEAVKRKAISAASTAWKDFAVFVTKADGLRDAHNLKKA